MQHTYGHPWSYDNSHIHEVMLILRYMQIEWYNLPGQFVSKTKVKYPFSPHE